MKPPAPQTNAHCVIMPLRARQPHARLNCWSRGWLVRQQKTLIPRSGHEILQPSRTAPHQDSQASLVFISIFGTMEAGNHTAAGADAPAAPDCGCGRTLLAQIARRNQLTVTGSVAAVFR